MASRSKQPSNSVSRGAAVSTPLNLVMAFAAAKAAIKFAVPLDVAAAGVALIAQGVSTLTQYIARGGRKGEAD